MRKFARAHLLVYVISQCRLVVVVVVVAPLVAVTVLLVAVVVAVALLVDNYTKTVSICHKA